MAKCPYCSEPAVAWRMWRVTRWSGYRCGGCRRLSRVPGGQLTREFLWAYPLVGGAMFLTKDWAADTWPGDKRAKYAAMIAIGLVVGWAVSLVTCRTSKLVPPEEAKRF